MSGDIQGVDMQGGKGQAMPFDGTSPTLGTTDGGHAILDPGEGAVAFTTKSIDTDKPGDRRIVLEDVSPSLCSGTGETGNLLPRVLIRGEVGSADPRPMVTPDAPPGPRPRVLSLFAGIGGFDLGLERAGFECAGQVEIDGFCLRVLSSRWPGSARWSDVRTVLDVERAGELSVLGGRGVPDADPERLLGVEQHPEGGDDLGAGSAGDGDAEGEWDASFFPAGCAPTGRRDRQPELSAAPDPEPGSIDLLTGGFPCQDLSVAGKRAGLAGSRSGLFWEIVRIAKVLRPAWGLFENVPGLLSSNNGRDMWTVLTGLRECWPAVGYRILDSQHFGVPQRRRRVFLVCGPTEAGVQAVLFEREGGGGDSPEGGAEGAGAAASLAAGSHRPGVSDPGRRAEDDVNPVVGTLREHTRPGSNTDYSVVDDRAAALAAHGKKDRGDKNENLVVAATLNTGGNDGGFRSEPGEHLVMGGGEEPEGDVPGERGPEPIHGLANALNTSGGGAHVGQDDDGSKLVVAIATDLPDVAPTLRGGSAGGSTHGKPSGSDQRPLVIGSDEPIAIDQAQASAHYGVPTLKAADGGGNRHAVMGAPEGAPTAFDWQQDGGNSEKVVPTLSVTRTQAVSFGDHGEDQVQADPAGGGPGEGAPGDGPAVPAVGPGPAGDAGLRPAGWQADADGQLLFLAPVPAALPAAEVERRVLGGQDARERPEGPPGGPRPAERGLAGADVDGPRKDGGLPETVGTMSASCGERGQEGKHGHGWGQQDWESGYVVPVTPDSGPVAPALAHEGPDASDDGTGRGTPNLVAGPICTGCTPKGHGRAGVNQQEVSNLIVDNQNAVVKGHGPNAGISELPGALREAGPPLVFEARIARNDRGNPEEVCPPLKAESGQTGKGDSAPLVHMPDVAAPLMSRSSRGRPQANTPGDKGADENIVATAESEVIPIQDGRAVEKAQHGPGVGEKGGPAYTMDTLGGQAVVIPIQDGRELERNQPSIGVGEPGSPAYTLNRVTEQAVGVSENQRGEVRETEYARQITAGGGKPGQGYPAARSGSSVRRLTPVECERLQGFPDGFTCLCTPLEKYAEDPDAAALGCSCSDSARYRALGNAVTVNVTNWLGVRIRAAMGGV